MLGGYHRPPRVHLHTGDVIIYPHTHPHIMRSAPGVRSVPINKVCQPARETSCRSSATAAAVISLASYAATSGATSDSRR